MVIIYVYYNSYNPTIPRFLNFIRCRKMFAFIDRYKFENLLNKFEYALKLFIIRNFYEK